jgi:hypothetical protein
MDWTYRTFAAALERTGYRCTAHCEAGFVPVWQRSGELAINLVVFNAQTHGYYCPPCDTAARPVHADLRV